MLSCLSVCSAAEGGDIISARFKKIFNGIAFRISVAIVVIIAATTMTVGWIILREERSTLELELRSKGRYLAELMAHSLQQPLLQDDRNTISTALTGAVRSKESIIVYAGVYDKSGNLIEKAYKDKRYLTMMPPPYDFGGSGEHTDITEDKSLPVYYLSWPVKTEDLRTTGYLRLFITKEFLNDTLESVRRKLFLLTAAIVFAGIMLGLWAARKVLRPVLILNDGVKQVGEGELGVEVPVVGMGEIRELAHSFNKMSAKLKELVGAIKSAQKNLVRTEKLYAVGEFSAGVAHEIRNPLTSIKLLVQTVKNRGQELSSKDLEVMEKEINRIDRIIQSFLAFARPEKVEMTNVNIRNVLEDVITITMPKMRQSEIKLVQTFPANVPDIRGNYDAVKQASLNIVLNAIQAMDGTGGTLGIEILCNDNSLSIIIRDTGIGIPKENMKRVFDPFFTTKKDGTGMGLALTHNIINDHSGKIEIDSTLGRGTVVTVEFPL